MKGRRYRHLRGRRGYNWRYESFWEEEDTDIWEEEEATTEGKDEVTIDGCDIEEDTVDPCESGLVGTFEDFEDSFFISDFHCFKKFLLMYSHTLELELFLARQNSSLLHCCFHKLFLKLQETVLRLLDKIGFYQISGRHFTVLNVSKPQKKICSRYI